MPDNKIRQRSSLLMLAGLLSTLAALLHIAIVYGGADWYRFFGAGEQMAQLDEAGSSYPTYVTLGIASILLIWGLYAFSAAGLVRRLPFIRLVLSVVTLVYLTRGLAGLILPFVSQHPAIVEQSVQFWLVSSGICLLFGLVHFVALRAHWRTL